MGTARPKRPKSLRRFITCAAITALAFGIAQPVVGAPVVRQGAGANAASLQAIVDLFRNDLGGPNNVAGPTQMSGRREINWDGVPDNFAEPNNFPPNFFNVNSPRGIVFNAVESETGSALNQFAVSATAASGVPVRFGNLNSSYTASFQTFSSQRLFIARNTPIMEVVFFVPGTRIPATVHGFGVVFTDVDSATGGNRTVVRCYGIDGSQLTAFSAPVHDGGLSFAGVSFNAGERIARVVIESGNAGLSSSNNDEVDGKDVVAMDDFIYGEPQALEYPVTPTAGEPFVVTVTIPLKFLSFTTTGAQAGFVNATLRCAPHHTYRIMSSTDNQTWHPATVLGAAAGPDQNLFNPRNPALWSAGSHSAPLSISTEGQNKLFYMVTDQVTGEVAFGETPDVAPTPTPTATPVPSVPPDTTPQPTATATPTTTPPGPTPEPTATASPNPPVPGPFKLLNIATRLRVQTGENVLIGGVIVTGSQPKKVIIRAVGPSLSAIFDGALGDPTLELYQGDTLLAANDNWKDSQQSEIEATTIPPTNDFESAIVQTLAPGFYTAVVGGQGQTTGIGVIEVYDLDQTADSRLANIATRGFVESGDSVMIGGLIVGGNATDNAPILLRAIGPSLGQAGVADALQDPTLELRDANGELLRENNNWQESQQAEIELTGIPPSDPAESAIVVTLPAGNYTAVVRGAGETTGVGLVEVYNLQ